MMTSSLDTQITTTKQDRYFIIGRFTTEYGLHQIQKCDTLKSAEDSLAYLTEDSDMDFQIYICLVTDRANADNPHSTGIYLLTKERRKLFDLD